MKKYAVTVFVEGQNVGTYDVEAGSEGQAQTRAMLDYFHAADAGNAPAMKSGAMVTYDVKEG